MTLQMEASPITKAEHALYLAQTPQQSKDVEAMAAAAKAWAKEQNDYELVVNAARVFILSRRKTTELIQPDIKRGGDGSNQYQSKGDNDVTLADYGFTKKQWNRRCKELEVEPEEIDEYIDDCIEKNIEPTVNGLLKFAIQIIGDSTGNEWYTPEEYIVSVIAVLGEIDLDPASCEEANETIKAKKIYTEFDSGLDYDWIGRVFMNPPYSQNKEFAEKMIGEYRSGRVTEAIVLLGAHAIETRWFANYWDHLLCFTGHRIRFNTPNGGKAIAGNIAGSVFIYLGKNQVGFAKEFSKHGYVVKRWEF